MPRRLLARPGLKSNPPSPPPPQRSSPAPSVSPHYRPDSLTPRRHIFAQRREATLPFVCLPPPSSLRRTPVPPLGRFPSHMPWTSSFLTLFLIPIILKQFMARSFLNFFSSSFSCCLYTFLIMPSKMLVGDIFTPIPCLFFSYHSSFLVCFFPLLFAIHFSEHSRVFSQNFFFSLGFHSFGTLYFHNIKICLV